MLKKINILALITFLSIFILAACGGDKDDKATTSSLDQIKEEGELVVAMNPEFAPFEFKTLVDGKNQVVGSDVKLAQAIADKLGVKLVLSEMSFDNVLNSLQAGKADLAISGISATAERAKVFDFSDSYYTAKNVVIIKKDKVDQYKGKESLSGQSVAVQKGSVQETVAKEQLPEISPVSLASVGALVNELVTGKVEAVVLEEPIAKGYIANHPELTVASIELDSSETDAYAIALNKEDDDLKKVVNEVVKELKESGKYETYVQEAFEQSLNQGE